MEASKTREIIKNRRLINRLFCKVIMKCLLEDKEPPQHIFSLIDKQQFYRIRENVQLSLRSNKNTDKAKIRNLPILKEISKKLPNFRWDIVQVKNKNGKIVNKLITNLGMVDGIQISLASALFCEGNLESQVTSKYFGNLSLSSFDEKLNQFQNLLTNLGAIPGENFDRNIIKNWFAKGLKGEKLTVFTPVCPDYSYIHLGRDFYRFTFNSLGNEVGVTAKKLVKNHATITKFFETLKFNVRYVAAIGDFEAFSPENLNRMGLTEQEFISKLKLSQTQLSKELVAGYETPLITEICGGKDKWNENYIKCTDRVKSYASDPKNRIILNKIYSSREPLLKNWFGSEMSIYQIKSIVLKQGAEYNCMGRVVVSNLDNCLILGVDHPKMSSFYQIGQSIPVIYLKTNYGLQ